MEDASDRFPREGHTHGEEARYLLTVVHREGQRKEEVVRAQEDEEEGSVWGVFAEQATEQTDLGVDLHVLLRGDTSDSPVLDDHARLVRLEGDLKAGWDFIPHHVPCDHRWICSPSVPVVRHRITASSVPQ